MKVKDIAVCAALALFLLTFSLLAIFLPKAAYSESERRPYTKFPPLTSDTLASGSFMSSFERYSLDAFPLRDFFRTLNTVAETDVFAQLDHNGLYESDGYVAAMEYPLHEDAITYSAGRFSYIYESFLRDTDAKVYLSVIPDKNYFLAPEAGRLSLDYDRLVTLLRENTKFADYIDIFPLLSKESYYKTDTHWRQENITGVADQLLRAMGTQTTATYTTCAVATPFRGVYAGQSALPLQAETIRYLTGDPIDAAVVRDEQNGKDIPVYALDKAQGRDPYELFLSGSLSLITIENPNAASDRSLVIFRDSFGSSIAPLLLADYAKITLVDIRYIQPAAVCQSLQFDHTDVLFLYSTLVLNNSSTIK